MLDSLKRRIVLLCLLALGLTWVSSLILSYQDTRQEVRQLLDAHLAQAAALLVAQSGDEIEEIENPDASHFPDIQKYTHSVSFQVWRHGTELGLRSANAPDQPLSDQKEGFSETNIRGVTWRVFSTWDRKHEHLIHVGEQTDVRDHLLREMAEHLLKPILFALPVLALLLWLAVRQGLQPLGKVTREIATRDPDRLDVIDTFGAPSEVRPLIERLNQLFSRIAASMDNTRRFTADAAHELRTPLAAIRAQAQVASASQQDEERRHALERVTQGCDQATHLLEQLLTLARLDESTAITREPNDLRLLAAEVVADLAPTALSRDIDVSVEEGAPVQRRVQAGLMRILIRNLVDNAIRYSPDGGAVSVAVTSAGKFAEIRVTDSGPGIPDEERERIFDRFYRILGSGQAGSGLGLSIVKRIADIHHACIALNPGSEGQGLCVSIQIPND